MQAKFSLAAAYQQGQSTDAAASTYEEILSEIPDDARALNNMAWMYIEAGNMQKAMKYAELAYNNNPGRPEIADTYGWVLVKQGKVERGLELLESAREKLPDNPDLLYHISAAWAALGETEKAIKQLVNILEKHDNFATRDEAEKLFSLLQ